MEMFFTINSRPHPLTYDNTNIESFSSLPISIQDSDPYQEEIDIITSTDDVLPPGVENEDSYGGEVDVVDVLRVDNSISNSEHEYSKSEDSDFDNPSVPLPPPEPPDENFDFKIVFEKEISVVRNTIVKFECIDARVKFDVFSDENDVLSYFMFVIFAKVFSLFFAKSEDIIFDPAPGVKFCAEEGGLNSWEWCGGSGVDWRRGSWWENGWREKRSSNRRRVPNIVEPEIRTIEEVVLMADRTMEELLQAPTKGYGEAIVIPEILAENFEIKTNLLQLVQANKFHWFERDNPHMHISNFKRMTATLKYRDVPNDAIKLMLFSYSLEGAARIWYEKEPPNSILTWDDLVNEISRFTQRFEETFGEAWVRFKEMLRVCPHHGFSELTQIDTFYNGLHEQDHDSLNAAVGGNLLNKTTREALKIIKNKSKVCYSRTKSNVSRVNTNSRDSVSKTDDRIDKLADHISNLVEIVNKQVITPVTAKAVEKTCVTCGGAHAYYDCITTDSNQPSVCAATSSYNQASTSGTLPSNNVPNPKGEMKVVTTRSGLAYEGASIPTNSPLEKIVEQNTEEITDKEHSNCPGSTAQVQPSVVPIFVPEPNVLRTQTKPTIPYPSRLNDQKLREKATNQMEKFFQIFYDLHFDISYTDALLLMPKFASTIKKKLGDPGKFLIPYDFLRMEVCHSLADLGASINLMPLSIWKNLSLPELTPTRMTLELADRSITRPKGVAKDVFIKVGKFHFPTDFVVMDFEADPRVPLILGRSFLRTGHALIDVYREEITLRVNDESITLNLNQTMRYSLTYDDNFVNRVDVIDIACEEFVQNVLDFQYNSKSSNPTLVSDSSIPENDFSKEPIVKSSSPTLTPFRESDFFLEEIKDFLNDDSIPTGIENSVYDPKGDILFLEKLLNEDPFQLPPMDLKLAEESKAKSFAIAWKISDIKVIDPRFCTHKILMEDDYKPAVQSQRRVNPKIHDVIKKEVIKLPDASMIYHISDSPRVSPIHCVPKKEGMTIVANENNELIPTKLVTGWRVCIGYWKLNDVTRKDHFPLPFMDQMLERLAGNEFYCFLDGFSGYFQIPIDPQDQEKTTFTCPYVTFAYRRMPFGLCNAPGIVLGHKISKSGIEADRAKVDVITKLPHLTTVKGVRSFLGHAECVDAFNTLKKKLIEAPILVVPDWNLPFELMCDASDFAIGAVLGQRKTKHFQPIHYASKTMTEAQIHYTTTEKEMLAVVYAFKKFRPYLVLSKSIVYTDHSALKYFLNKQDAKPRAIISDHGTHFYNDQFTRVMIKYGVTHRLATAYHPKISGQVEVFNRGLKQILERMIGENRASQHRAYWALKHVNFNLKTAGDHRKLQLNELSELRDQAYENSMIYKERTKKLHYSKIKNRIFNVGDQVLLFNSRLKIFSRKLKTRWSGPFTITQVFSYGTIELSQPNGPNFKVNGHRVKHYFGGNIPSNVVPDLHTFPMDK
nr:DNA-directed DNA polymerase [Tanacetum cinerariifolium]